jgi:hypothetical protein
LRRCAYDVRPTFAPAAAKAVQVRCDTLPAAARPPGAAEVFEVIAAIFDLLAALDDWIDPKGLDADPGFARLLADPAARGLIEVPVLGIPINIDKSCICVLARAGARVVHIG